MSCQWWEGGLAKWENVKKEDEEKGPHRPSIHEYICNVNIFLKCGLHIAFANWSWNAAKKQQTILSRHHSVIVPPPRTSASAVAPRHGKPMKQGMGFPKDATILFLPHEMLLMPKIWRLRLREFIYNTTLLCICHGCTPPPPPVTPKIGGSRLPRVP